MVLAETEIVDLMCVFGGGFYRPVYGPLDFTGEDFISPLVAVLTLVAILVFRMVGGKKTLAPLDDVQFLTKSDWQRPVFRDILLQEKNSEIVRLQSTGRPPFASGDVTVIWKTAYLLLITALLMAGIGLL